MQTQQEYNANNQLTAQHWTVGSTTYSETYTYSKTEGTLSGYNNALGESITLNYDSLRRLSSVTGGKYTRTYTYRDVSTTNTTSQVSSLTYSGLSNAPSFGYSYDVLGNIATYNQNGTTYTYAYDAQNQLLSQTGGGKTYSYTYDAAGNILTASDGTTSHSYTYGHAAWKDLLTAFDGQTISYDASGNPTGYYNGTRWTMTWQEGRRLMSASDGTTSLSFSYDSEGLRLTKTVGTTVHTYLYAGGKLIRETIATGGTVTDVLDFFYDHAGHPYALKHTTGGVTTTYYYITNLQGDVLSLVNASGTPVASYTYDPYGKPLTATGTLANINPLRYRSYVYDPETGLYYLQSRYYDPTIGRFLNADAFVSTGQGLLGNNMFAYCLNNYPNYVDPIGFASFSSFKEYTDPLGMPWEGGSAGGGTHTSSYSYLFFAGLKHSNNKDISSTYDSVEELLSAGSVNEAAEALDKLNQEDIVNYGKNLGRIIGGTKNIAKGIGMILVPDPTPVNDAAGPILIALGIVNVIRGTICLVSEMGDQK